MTQEELDSLLMSEEFSTDEETPLVSDELDLGALTSPSDGQGEPLALEESDEEEYDSSGYRLSANKAWPPPPPTEDHKVVYQLDDVTRDSEVKANEVFDKLENVSNEAMSIESDANELKKFLKNQKELLEKLNEKFPTIEAFKVGLGNIEEANVRLESIINSSLNAGDAVMSAMDIMQYQDIHRQKIERVINVMRALSKYMNSLFEGKLDDTKRVSSATHIHGDTSTEDVVNEDDIEALIASFGKSS